MVFMCLIYKLVATPGQGCCLICLCTTNTYRTCASSGPSTFLKLTNRNVVPPLRTFCTAFRYKSQRPTPFISRLLSLTLPCVCQGDGRSLIPLTSHPPCPHRLTRSALPWGPHSEMELHPQNQRQSPLDCMPCHLPALATLVTHIPLTVTPLQM